MDQDEIIFTVLIVLVLALGTTLFLRIRRSSQKLREMISREKVRIKAIRNEREVRNGMT